jgi:hypothetical protein
MKIAGRGIFLQNSLLFSLLAGNLDANRHFDVKLGGVIGHYRNVRRIP